MVRMNIIMPDEIAEHLKSVGNKSRYVVEALQEKIQRERTRQMRTLLAGAYTSVADEDVLVSREWAATSSDGSEKE